MPALPTIRDTALAMADRPNLSASYRADLRHIARDAQAAIDGCPESMASVEAFVAADHDLALLSVPQGDAVREAA